MGAIVPASMRVNCHVEVPLIMITKSVRFSIWVFALFAVAVVIVLAGKLVGGNVVFLWATYRVDMSLMTFSAIALLSFALIYGLIRAVLKAVRMPDAIRKAKRERELNRAREALFAGQRALFAGQFLQAENLARVAIEHPTTSNVGAALAAWSAFESGKLEAAVPYLERIEAGSTRTGRAHDEDVAMRDVSMAYMLLAEGKSAEALTLLRTVHQHDAKNPGALKMKIEAEMAEAKWQDALDTLTPLQRTGLLPENAARQMRLNAERHLLEALPRNRDNLLATFKALNTESRIDVNNVTVVAQKLIAMGAAADAVPIIETAIDKRGEAGWDSALVSLYADCKGDSTLAQIERTEKWLRQHPRDSAVLLALGKLCIRQALWGKAQSYLEASVALQPSLDAHMTLAGLMEQLGKRDEAVRHIRRSAELAR
jgi:HemY protein